MVDWCSKWQPLHLPFKGGPRGFAAQVRYIVSDLNVFLVVGFFVLPTTERCGGDTGEETENRLRVNR